jgi:HlyD family secretion protein
MQLNADSPLSKAAAKRSDWQSTASWIRCGHLTLAALGAGLLGFGLLSIAGAVVAPGVVNVESNYKTVQHLDGGIVDKILVRNGDRVTKGDLLLKLDETAARANHAVAMQRHGDLLVQQARLEAERDRKDTFAPPPAASAADPNLANVVTAQRALFEARRASRSSEQEVQHQRIAQLTDETRGLESQITARQKESELNAKELAGVLPLFERGFASVQRLVPLQREAARLEGELGRLRSELSKTRGAIAEVQLKMAQTEKDFTQGVVDELRKVQAAIAEVVEQRTTLEDKLARMAVRAPIAGRVHALAIHTEGGVIQPASPILQVIPDGERLMVDAQIAPQEIDRVRIGQPATVRLPAFNARTTPKLLGSVVNVSAAQFADQRGGSYFTAQVAIAEGELAHLPAGHHLRPGMPAEVYIETSSRSILSYFTKPLTDALLRSFRES